MPLSTLFFLLAVMGVAQEVQYATNMFSAARLPGNKFFNGILFGFAELFSYHFANTLLVRLPDMTAFRTLVAIGISG